MYNYPYMNQYNSQSNLDRINAQISELEKMREQLQKPPIQPSINQTFQLASPNNNAIRYVNTIDDVSKESVFGDTPFFSKDMSVVWIKNTKGEIKVFELNEIIAKDDKDIKIELLQAQIDELKKGIRTYEHDTVIDEPTTNANESKEPAVVSTIPKSKAKSK